MVIKMEKLIENLKKIEKIRYFIFSAEKTKAHLLYNRIKTGKLIENLKKSRKFLLFRCKSADPDSWNRFFISNILVFRFGKKFKRK